MTFVVPPCKLRDIGADMLAGRVEFGLFAFGECGIEDFFDAVRADDARQACIIAAFALFAGKQRGAGGRIVFVAEHGLRKACRGGCNGVFRALFAGIHAVSASAGVLLSFLLVKSESLRIVLRELSERLACDVHVRPVGELRIAMLPSMYAQIDFWSTLTRFAMALRSRAESNAVPVPMILRGS